MPQWTFLTNHSHVLICIHRDPHLTLREISHAVGITERSAQRIIGELIEHGVVAVEKDGRRNRYRVDADRPLRHPVEASCTVRDLLTLVEPDFVQNQS